MGQFFDTNVYVDDWYQSFTHIPDQHWLIKILCKITCHSKKWCKTCRVLNWITWKCCSMWLCAGSSWERFRSCNCRTRSGWGSWESQATTACCHNVCFFCFFQLKKLGLYMWSMLYSYMPSCLFKTLQPCYDVNYSPGFCTPGKDRFALFFRVVMSWIALLPICTTEFCWGCLC